MSKFLKISALLIILMAHFSIKIAAQTVSVINNQTSNSYRGISSYKNHIWVSGSNGTVGFSQNNGVTWKFQQIKGFEKTDFRDIHVFDENNIIVMGIASPAFIVRTSDQGKTWETVYTNHHEKAFLDAFYFSKNKGVCIGDPIDETPFTITTQDEGKTWQEQTIFNYPLKNGEAFYAASGSNIIITNNTYFAVSGGSQARLLMPKKSIILPTMQGLQMTGTNSIAKMGKQLVIVGGDYEKLSRNDSIAAYSKNNGKTWTISNIQPNGYKSCVVYINKKTLIACGITGVDISTNGGKSWKNISKLSFNSCVYNAQDRSVYFCGAKGAIGKLVFNQSF